MRQKLCRFRREILGLLNYNFHHDHYLTTIGGRTSTTKNTKLLLCNKRTLTTKKSIAVSHPKPNAEFSKYDCERVESLWYSWWKKRNVLRKIEKKDRNSFILCLPPPNVTGNLHLGHALTVAIQDSIVRFQQMNGKHNFSRAVVEAFKRLFQDGLIFRDARLVNWSPYLQSTLSDQEVDYQPINAPTEIKVPGIDGPVTFGWLYFVDYSFEGQCAPGEADKLTVATTRPETIFADVALAVNPCDSRYSSLIGQKLVKNPLDPAKILPIIGDHSVDMGFGTGVLKITPGHDKNDWQIGKRHNLPLDVSCLDESGKISQDFEEFHGQNRFEARGNVVKKLKSDGFLRNVEFQPTAVPVCSRSGDVIEPMLKEQWFLNCREMSQSALSAVETGQIRLEPDLFRQHWRQWLEKPEGEDWCISRQLAWGHQIPAYRWNDQWTAAGSALEAEANFLGGNSNLELESGEISQDQDVLDTWFSSALVPLVVAGWPDQLDPGRYPQSLLETGHDILGFWVARMVMLGQKLAGVLPFRRILLHGLLRDAQGRKMSKSLGNVVDPLDVINGRRLEELKIRLREGNLPEDEVKTAEKGLQTNFPDGILKSGADALRFALLKSNVKDLNINFDVNLVVNGRNFCNKLWNGMKYGRSWWLRAEGFQDLLNLEQPVSEELSDPVDQWMLSRLSHMVQLANEGLKRAEFPKVTFGIYDFWWAELCAVYLEYTKQFLDGVTDSERIREIAWIFGVVSSVTLRCLAPVMPFITEELYCLMPWRKNGASIHELTYPTVSEVNFKNPEIDRQMEEVLKIIHASRSLRNEFGIAYKNELNAFVVGQKQTLEAVKKLDLAVKQLANLHISECDRANQNIFDRKKYLTWFVDENTELYVEMKDIDQQTVSCRLQNKLEKKLRKREELRRKMEKWTSGKSQISEKKGKNDKKWREITNLKLQQGQGMIDGLNLDIEKLEDMVQRLRN